ncbi:MAG: AraC family transcriptional regulator [Caulobacteraceae bacterium]
MAAHVRSATLSNFAQVARQRGLSPIPMLREVGLDPAVLADPDMRLPARRVFDLLENAARASGWQNFGLRMAESRRLAEFGAVSLLIAHQSTLREGLETTIRYLPMINEALTIELEEIGDLVVIREALIIDDAAPTRQAYELAVGALFRMCNALLGPRWRPLMVHFAHSAPADLTVHRRLFGPAIQFGSEFNGVICSSEDLDRANPAADLKMANYARRYVDALGGRGRLSAGDEVRQAAYHLLPLGRASIVNIARTLGLNPRSLQRRLAAEDEEFTAILNGVRRELARRHIENPNLSMTTLSEILGYSQLSSFTRWFSAEFGVSPSGWRAGTPEP